MASGTRAAWAEGDDVGAVPVPKRSPGGDAESVAHTVVPSGSQTERLAGRHGGRGPVRRRHFATTRSRFAQQMENRQVGESLDNMSLETEAHINRKLAEMQQRDLASVNRLASKLRKDYDRLRVQSSSKSQELRAVQEQLLRLERLGQSQGGRNGRSDIEIAEAKLNDTSASHEQALRRKEMYNFMATRLKEQTMALDKEAKDLQELLAVTREDKEQAALNLHAARQERAAAESVAAKLHKKLESGRVKRAARLQRFDDTMVEQEEKRKQMELREQRRIEIAKLAQGDLNEEGEDRLKQLFLVRKIYSNMLLTKLQAQRRQTDKLEDAFQRIRSATGLTDVDAIVEKFMNRDQTNEELEQQMKDARARIEDLRSTHVRLQQLLDAQTMVKETTHENRQLYHRVDDFDRRLTEARHLSEEAKQRSFKIMITLEESRACIAKLLNKLDFDPSAQLQAASRPGTGRSSRNISRSATPDMVEGCKVENGQVVVSVDNLPAAINLLDQRLTKYLEIVAAIFEKEEQIASHSKNGDEASNGTVRRMSLASAKEVIATVASNGPSLLNNLSARQQPGVGGADTAAARRTTLSMLAGKASDRVYRSMMAIQPDLSAANLRVHPSEATLPIVREMGVRGGVRGSDDEDDDDDAYLAGLAEAAGLDASSGTALRRTRETGVVVQRESLKRLSAMLSDRRTRNKQRMGAKKMSRLHKKRSKASAAAMSDDDTVSGPDSPLQRSPAGKATRMQSRRDVLAMAES